MKKSMETLRFFSLPAIITGANLVFIAPWNYVIQLAAGREVSPFFYFAVTFAGVALVWAGWRGWKKAKQVELLDAKSDFLCLPQASLLARKNLFKFFLIFNCILFAYTWVYPGPVTLLLAAVLVAIFSRKYLTSKAELQYVRAKEGLS